MRNTEHNEKNTDSKLNSALQHLRNVAASHSTPPNIEAALLAALLAALADTPTSSTPAVNKMHPPTQSLTHASWHARLAYWLAPGLGAVASVVMVGWMLLMPHHRAVVEAASQIQNDAPFFALQSLDVIAAEPSPTIIETKMSRIDLTAYGVPINPETAGDFVRTQMLVSAAGRPLALRFQD